MRTMLTRFRPLPRILAHLLLLVLAACNQVRASDDAVAGKEENRRQESIPPVTKEIQQGLVIGGKTIPYRVSAGTTELLKPDGKPSARVFSIAYERLPEAVPAEQTSSRKATSEPADLRRFQRERPILFAFNGGPGSSSVWLHIGMLGPKIVTLPANGVQAPPPPCLVDWNPHSILDVCDLVFVDPVSTGFSRAADLAKSGEFHGLEEDIESTGEFIRRWIDSNDRWASPKFLLGESYGGIRVAGLAKHLQSRFGMNLNGVVLLSALLDFATIQPSPGNDLAYACFLPSYTGVALHHAVIQGDPHSLQREAEWFAFSDYASALLAGNSLPEGRKAEVAATLAKLTGIPAETWLLHRLRIDPGVFRAELLRGKSLVIGRFDGRVAWPSPEPSSQSALLDPSYTLALPVFSTAMFDYLAHEIGYKEPQPYEILTSKVHPWRWDAENEVVNVSDRLSGAMRDNPHLRVLVMAGHTDLATPPAGVAYSLRHLPDQIPDLSKRVTTTEYAGGHMFYLNPGDLQKSRADLIRFIRP